MDAIVPFHCDSFNDEGVHLGCSCVRDSRKRHSTASSSDSCYSTASDMSEVLSLADCDQPDSLTLAMRELQSRQVAESFFEAHQRIGDSSRRGSDEFLEMGDCFRRSSSLKSTKTPPGTPNQMKKAVRFADAFGLDLAYVRHVFDLENPPIIPPQATKHLNLQQGTDLKATAPADLSAHSSSLKLIVSPLFAQPGDSASFTNRVACHKVMLERAVSRSDGTIAGIVRVSNLSFEKRVSLRVTRDAWVTVTTVTAAHVCCTSDGASDQFRFELLAPRRIGEKVSFCIEYLVGADVYWDSNFGDNYSFDCYAINSSR